MTVSRNNRYHNQWRRRSGKDWLSDPFLTEILHNDNNPAGPVPTETSSSRRSESPGPSTTTIALSCRRRSQRGKSSGTDDQRQHYRAEHQHFHRTLAWRLNQHLHNTSVRVAHGLSNNLTAANLMNCVCSRRNRPSGHLAGAIESGDAGVQNAAIHNQLSASLRRVFGDGARHADQQRNSPAGSTGELMVASINSTTSLLTVQRMPDEPAEDGHHRRPAQLNAHRVVRTSSCFDDNTAISMAMHDLQLSSPLFLHSDAGTKDLIPSTASDNQSRIGGGTIIPGRQRQVTPPNCSSVQM